MKKMKLALIATIVACALMNVAMADEWHAKPKRCVNIVLSQAEKDASLVIDMYNQLNAAFLIHPQPLYLANVVHNKTLYRILGSADQWQYFFDNKWKFVKKDARKMDIRR